MKPQVIFSATLIVLITVFAQSTLFAQKEQEELKLNIQLRPRAEFRKWFVYSYIGRAKTGIFCFATESAWINLFEKPKAENGNKYPGGEHLGK